MKKVQILGAGLAGLAAAWHLKTLKPELDVHLFDPNGIGKGASGVSAGLLHTYGGMHAKLSRFGRKALAETVRLLQIADPSCYKETGIFRPVTAPHQLDDFKKCAAENNDVIWQDNGILIRSGIVVDTRKYLDGLWTKCQEIGVQFGRVNPDLTLFAIGAATKKQFPHLPLTLIKGQTLLLKWKKELPKLKLPINGKAYLICHGESATLGATFEREFSSEEPEIHLAKRKLLPLLEKMYPELSHPEVIECRAGIRVATPDHLPLIKKIDNKQYVLTGMGSKGLLYHAFFAKACCHQILEI